MGARPAWVVLADRVAPAVGAASVGAAGPEAMAGAAETTTRCTVFLA